MFTTWGSEVMLWDSAICLLFVTANFFCTEANEGLFFNVRDYNLAKHKTLITDAEQNYLHRERLCLQTTDKNVFNIFAFLSETFAPDKSNRWYFIKVAVILLLYRLHFVFWWVVFPTSKMKIAESFDLCMHGVKQKKRKCWPLQGT